MEKGTRISLDVDINETVFVSLSEAETKRILDSLDIDFLESYLADRCEAEGRMRGPATEVDSKYQTWWEQQFGSSYPTKLSRPPNPQHL